MLLGNAESHRFLPKDLYKVDSSKKIISLVLRRKQQTKVKIYIDFFDDYERVSSKSYILKDGINDFAIEPKENELYLRLLFRVESDQEDEIELSDLKLTN